MSVKVLEEDKFIVIRVTRVGCEIYKKDALHRVMDKTPTELTAESERAFHATSHSSSSKFHDSIDSRRFA